MIRKHQLSLLFCIISIFFLVIATRESPASTFLSDKRIVISPADTLDDDLYAFGQDGIISGQVTHDVISFVQRQNINGVIGGTLISGSFDAIIRGEIKNSALIFAFKLYIDGIINNNLTAYAYEIEISPGSRIGKDVTLKASEISIAGNIERNLILEADEVVIAGRVGGNIKITANKITVTSPAEIIGDIDYRSPNEILIDDNVSVGGEIYWKDTSKTEVTRDDGIDWGFRIYVMLAFLLSGLIIIPVFNKHTRTSAMQIVEKPLVTLGIGFISFCVAPIAMVILFVTLVGIPASFMLALIFAIVFYVGKVYVAIALGWMTIRAFRKGARPRQGWSLLLGLFILMFIFAIPVAGVILYFAAVFFGFGAFILGVNQCRIDMGNGRSKRDTPPQ